MNPEPAEVLNLSPVIERNASIELSPGISEKEYDFFSLFCILETVQDFFVQVEHEITHLLEIIPFSVYISSSDLTYEQS